MIWRTSLQARAWALALCLGVLTPHGVWAAGKPAAGSSNMGVPVPGLPQIAARAWVLMDVTTGQLIGAQSANMRVEPASLTKLMTAYLVFNALKDKRLSLEMRPPVSAAAYQAKGSRMFVDPAQPATVQELLQGLIVQSGNDAAIILAEAVSGSETAFAGLMNRQAERLGMRQSHFMNASGLPDPQHYSTAADLATLAARLIDDHPEFYPIYSQREYSYNQIKQPNRNRLLFIDPTVDGVKTGHTDAAGYCLIASSRREQGNSGMARRLLSVVLGAGSETARAIESQKLLNWGFANSEVVRLYQKGQEAARYPVFKGETKEVAVGFTQSVLVTVARGQADRVRGEIERIQPLLAPIAAGQRLGTLRVRVQDRVLAEYPVVALGEVPEGGWLARTWDSLKLRLK